LKSIPVLTAPAWTVYCDGSAMPNPGRMGAGVVITAPDGTRHALSQAGHAVGCNNEAELRALMLALGELKALGATAVRAYSDNSILVEQLGGTAARPIARMAALYEAARDLLDSFEAASLHWVPRHRNQEADALARAALGFGPKPPPRPKHRRR
jgi:ribonuclease HI